VNPDQIDTVLLLRRRPAVRRRHDQPTTAVPSRHTPGADKINESIPSERTGNSRVQGGPQVATSARQDRSHSYDKPAFPDDGRV
jgi:hypothetical protein